MYEISVLGWIEETVIPMVNGIVQSIMNAHQQLQEGKITISQGLLMDTNINRSPHAYLLNPAEERSQYEHNVDKTMTVLGFKNIEGDDMGLVSWYIL
jgi:neutral ceramidase